MIRRPPSNLDCYDPTLPAGGPAAPALLRTAELDGPQLIAGRYQITGVLGSGAMGAVYRARDLELGEEVALKLLRPDLLDSPAMIDRFRTEVKLARRVTHFNVARAYDIGEHQGAPFLTMEFIDGEPLSQKLRREGPLPLAALIEIALSICAGLGAAHAAGVVHRDLKPDNVLLGKEGRVAITDFGIARAVLGSGTTGTQRGVLGTPAYMAPEQVDAAPDIDHRADLYALGCMLFEMLTGEVPFTAETPYAVALARLLRPPPDPRARRPGVSDGAAEIVLRCLARLPVERYASAAEVASALAALSQPSAVRDSMVQQLLASRDQIRRRYEERLKEQALLSGEIAHELSNPLASIKGLTELCQAEGAPGRLAERLQVLRGEVNRMESMLEAFLSLSQSLLPLSHQQVDLSALCGEVMELHEELARGRGVALAFDSGAPAQARCDPSKIKQVIINLVQNAIENSPTGERVEVTVAQHGDTARITVLDRGPWVPADALEDRPGFTTKEGGSGLGLRIARLLVAQHGGRLVLEDRAGGGCAAEIMLPIAGDPELR